MLFASSIILINIQFDDENYCNKTRPSYTLNLNNLSSMCKSQGLFVGRNAQFATAISIPPEIVHDDT